MTDGRLPNFIIIGAMKSATSTLYHWLRENPNVFLASPKETNFFSFEKDWVRGADWYSSLFSEARPAQQLGEASVSYTYHHLAAVSARRMAEMIPTARLVYVVRNPIDRLRSHYRHEIQRNREHRHLLEALEADDNPYVGYSMYFRCLEPYIRSFPRGQICVVRFEDLVRQPFPGWFAVLHHLGLSKRPAPQTAYNVTRENAQWTRAMGWLKRAGILKFRQVARLPRPVRKLGRLILMRDGSAYEQKLDESDVDLPQAVTDRIWSDVRLLQEWLGAEEPLWDPPAHAPARAEGIR